MQSIAAPSLSSILKQINSRNILGLLKSFFIYYLVPFRWQRMKRFYAKFITTGDLCFDIGAHIGNRSLLFSQLGAQAIACEPQPLLADISAYLLRKKPSKVLRICVGESNKEVDFFLSDSHPTLATASQEWRVDFQRIYYPNQEVWQSKIRVKQITLEDLIRQFGLPTFCKIDAEGLEPNILKGLKQAIKVISFEFVPATPKTGFEALGQINGLAPYEYNFSFKEKMKFAWPNWCDYQIALKRLRRLNKNDFSGDIYARRL